MRGGGASEYPRQCRPPAGRQRRVALGRRTNSIVRLFSCRPNLATIRYSRSHSLFAILQQVVHALVPRLASRRGSCACLRRSGISTPPARHVVLASPFRELTCPRRHPHKTLGSRALRPALRRKTVGSPQPCNQAQPGPFRGRAAALPTSAVLCFQSDAPVSQRLSIFPPPLPRSQPRLIPASTSGEEGGCVLPPALVGLRCLRAPRALIHHLTTSLPPFLAMG